MYWAEYKGVYFIEGMPSGAQPIRAVKAELLGQLKSLDHVKDAMIRQVKSAGGNAVIDFKYGQKKSFWGYDSTKWTGSGTIAKVSPSNLTRQSPKGT
jgi:hypothetical protein